MLKVGKKISDFGFRIFFEGGQGVLRLLKWAWACFFTFSETTDGRGRGGTPKTFLNRSGTHFDRLPARSTIFRAKRDSLPLSGSISLSASTKCAACASLYFKFLEKL